MNKARKIFDILCGSFTRVVFAVILPALLIAGCYREISPITGEKESYGYSWEQERELGKEADLQLSKQLGIYEDERLQAYVNQIGERVLSGSDFRKPNVPEAYRGTDFTFRVLDSSVLNAFALPGGYVYLTRGLLAHMENEAQLAVVLGHEIGHVAGRHSAQQALKAQWSQLGLIGATILGQGVLGGDYTRDILGVGSTVLQLLLNKYSRENEREADLLGVRYAAQEGYDVSEGAGFFRVLDRMAQLGGSRIPGWQSTHPEPAEREETILQLARQLASEYPMELENREAFLNRIEGMVVGDDPREGFVESGIFYHPDLRFQMDVPDGWRVQNETSAVLMSDSRQRAAFVLELAGAGSPRAAAAELVNGKAIQILRQDRSEINGLPAFLLEANARTEQGPVFLVNAFVQHGGRVYSLMGLTAANNANALRNTFLNIAGSFQVLRNAEFLDVKPYRLALLKVREGGVFEQFIPSDLPPEMTSKEIAILNQVELDERIEPGSILKIPRRG